ncbi:Small-conductance mechanosensitive channel [Sphingomonas gellani]|uniref:Small-conductance mechanosensitive channel n=1 Tax=Sphingomonas gellani TaxID=1166340 RepID=A0A1H8GKA1_9SPHN|nr:DUF3772 domain-containing protein [Sphingomonas gellani]SEN44446.1 Small-conductance mechanosensitive channel [Sphingomonas gellani]
MSLAKVVARRGRLLCALLLALAFNLYAGAALAQATPVATLSRQLSQAETDLAAVDHALDSRVDKDARTALRSKALAARDAAADASGRLQDQLSLVDAQVAQLGPAPAGTPEAPDIRAKRASLSAQHAALDSAVKRGRLLGVTASQLVDEIEQSQAEQFGQRISAHVPSPVSPTFWRAVLRSVPRDLRRVGLFAETGGAQIQTGWRHTLPWQAIVGIVVALLLLIPGRLAAQRVGQRFLVDGAPGHRVRRSGYALWRIVVGTLAPMLAGLALLQGLRWSGLLPDRWGDMFDALVLAMSVSGFTASVGGALLLRRQPSWRVAPIGDEAASRLRPYTLLLAALTFVNIMLDAFNKAVSASNAALVATEALEATLHLLLIGAALLALGRVRAAQTSDTAGETRRAGLAAATLVAWIVAAVAGIALLWGYVGFSLFLVQLVTWSVLLGSSTYLLMVTVDDVATTLFVQDSPLGRTLTRGLGLGGSSIDQFGVLLSGVLRLGLATVAFGMLLSPFGAGDGVGSLFGRLGGLAQGVEVGGVSISPGTILRGVAVLFVGMALVRAFMGWLEGRYLPATALDGSGRNSVSLIARYVGIALAVIWSLASLGIGVEKIALLLSALSVGIGFGLQAITQNFVSGLILLAERPIKIGDLVRVGTDEGDVKRISVRSTEIELADHSTLIVPNSELITKSVLNKTLASPLGRMQIQFSVPIGTDAERVRDIVRELFGVEPAVLDEPAPTVFIDTISDGRIMFNCFAHVASPRAAYSARSAVLMALLARFRDEQIDIGTVPQRLELVPMPGSDVPPIGATPPPHA